jgi:GNAT superfamily N-acetyltransferase
MSNLVLTADLARRLELAEAHIAVGCAQTFLRFQADRDISSECVAGGYAVYTGSGSPLTQAVAVAINDSISGSDFDDLEEFFAGRKEAVRVEACPLANPELFRLLGERGYRATEFTNVTAQHLSRLDQVSMSTGQDAVAVSHIQEGDEGAWAKLVADGFADEPPSIPGIVELMTMIALTPGIECYTARVDGRPAAGGALFSHDGVATLFATSTLREFRGRGAQTALLRERLARARQNQAELALCLASPGSVSLRNITRHGFQSLYTRVKFEKEFRDRSAQ